MSGLMKKTDLLADLEASLSDAGDYCVGRFERFLNDAVADFSRVRPRTLIGHIELVAGQSTYDAPADLYGFKVSDWGQNARHSLKPWETNYPRVLPVVTVLHIEPKNLHLSPAPSAGQIAALGRDFSFFYFAAHKLDEDAALTTIRSDDRGLLLLRAQIEAMRHIAFRNTGKTVSVKHVVSGQTKAGHPAELARQLLDEFEARAACLM